MYASGVRKVDRTVTIGGLAVSAPIGLVLPFALDIRSLREAVPVIATLGYSALATSLLLLRRPSANVMLNGAAAAMVVAVLLEPIPGLRPLLVLTVVVLPVIGATIMRRWWQMPAMFTIVALLVEVNVSEESVASRVAEAIGTIAVMWIATWLVSELSWAVGSMRARSETLFDRSPVPMWDVDYSDVALALDVLRQRGVTDLVAHLDEEPGCARALAERVRVRATNPAAMDLFGEPGFGGPLGDLLNHPTDASVDRFVEELHALWSGSGNLGREFEMPTRHGDVVWVVQNWSPTSTRRGNDYSSVIVTATDLSAQKRAAELLEGQVKQKDEFIAAVSHELRTPLAVVVGLSQELRDGPGRFSAEETGELVDMIATQSMDVAYIVEDLLVAARIDTGNITVIPEPTRIADALASVVPPGIGYEVAPNLVAHADPYRLRQVIRNLVTNASRYGGPTCRIVARSVEEGVEIDVRDDGLGIPRTMVDAVFQPYGRGPMASLERLSVGLGLTVSRELAELMDGSLYYLRDRDETVFRLTLPSVSVEISSQSRNSLDPTRGLGIG